jgi:hypothetical protein
MTARFDILDEAVARLDERLRRIDQRLDKLVPVRARHAEAMR